MKWEKSEEKRAFLNPEEGCKVSCVHASINKGGAAVAFSPVCDCPQVPAKGYSTY